MRFFSGVVGESRFFKARKVIVWILGILDELLGNSQPVFFV